MEKVCLTTFVYGEKYQAYIPFLAYSFNKAYPEYDLHIFVYGELAPNIKQQIDSLGLEISLTVHEHTFSDFTKMTPFISKTLRWLLWDDLFLDYDYLYTVDIDMFYIREPMPLHEQHKKHMKMLNLPFSNIARKITYSPLRPIKFLQTIKNFGLLRAIESIAIHRTQYRITGLHFVNVKKYYSVISKEYLHEQRELRKKGIMPNGVYDSSDEIYHYKILENAGFDLADLPLMSNSTNMLDPSPNRLEFRPHHGIHLGCFRTDGLVAISNGTLDSETYHYYVKIFKDEIIADPIFLQMLNNSPENIKESFIRLFDYYNIPQTF